MIEKLQQFCCGMKLTWDNMSRAYVVDEEKTSISL
jgi:hypothetical protein